MTGILPIDASGVSAPSTAASKAKVDYDAFLQLLVAEMKNQDPTEPMDSAQFISQLASFSNVEQGIQTNDKLGQLLSGQRAVRRHAGRRAHDLAGRRRAGPRGSGGDGRYRGAGRSRRWPHGRPFVRLDAARSCQLRGGPVNEADALDLVQLTTWTIIVASAPAIVAAMVVGLTIALLQALTQVQEMTLTFVPKIMAIFAAVMLAATFMGAQMGTLAQITMSRIQGGF